MRRLTLGLAALVLFATACGSGDADDAQDVIAGLDLSVGEAACFETEFDERGLDMDALLTADRDDLSADELQAVLDISAACAGAGEAASTDDGSDDDADTDDADTPDDDADADADDESDESDEPETTEPPADSDRRGYSDLNGFEQAFVDGLVQSGGTVEIGICMLDEFDEAGISLLDLAELGLNDDAEPDGDFLAAILRCGDELADAGIFDTDDFFGGADGVTYGDNPELDALWDACAAGDAVACDDLYFQSAIGSDYEAFGSTCGETDIGRFGRCSVVGADTYGDDPGLDAMWDACAAGDLGSCDDLFFASPVDSVYEAFGSTCGETTTEQYGGCGSASTSDANTYGDDAELDALWDACAGGSLEACDDLYWASGVGTVYESFGSSCGETTTEQYGSCALDATGAENYGDDAELDALWDACAGGSLEACDDLWFNSGIGSGYESFAESCGGLSTDPVYGTCESTFGG
ncbi:MAG: hypothetical protein AAGA90_16285 [Actinomycetota bacterium]